METEEVYDEPANDTSHMDADVVENGSRIVNASMYSRNALNIPTYHSFSLGDQWKPHINGLFILQ
jgi:hypothetical protein